LVCFVDERVGTSKQRVMYMFRIPSCIRGFLFLLLLLVGLLIASITRVVLALWLLFPFFCVGIMVFVDLRERLSELSSLFGFGVGPALSSVTSYLFLIRAPVIDLRAWIVRRKPQSQAIPEGIVGIRVPSFLEHPLHLLVGSLVEGDEEAMKTSQISYQPQCYQTVHHHEHTEETISENEQEAISRRIRLIHRSYNSKY